MAPIGRLAFLGTGTFAVPLLRRLPELADELLVISTPDRPAGRGLNPRPSPVAEAARARELHLATPERLRSDELDAAQVVALADPFAPDAPLLALARDDRTELRDYFARLRDVRLEIGGEDLAALGLPESPRVGEVLAELRRRKLNGELDGRESELAAARALIEEP